MIADLIKAARKFIPDLNEKRVREACVFAEKLYDSGQECLSRPHRDKSFRTCSSFEHALKVAELVLPFYPREDVLIAALMHEVPCISQDQISEVKRLFGSEVATILECMEGLFSVAELDSSIDVESQRKLFLALAKDIRVVLIKIADQLEVLHSVPAEKVEHYRTRAKDAINIFAPIAARFGIYRLKVQLEDEAFRILQPKEYREINEQVLEKLRLCRKDFDLFQKNLQEELRKTLKLEVVVSGRVKSVYSIYDKMKKKGRTSLDQIFDLFAVRVIVPDQYRDNVEDLGHCYRALAYIHGKYKPLMHRFKDYFARPKWNGYRSLHTTIAGMKNDSADQQFEIQIRTAGMHREAEYGIASHWWYDSEGGLGYAFSKEHIQNFLDKYNQWHRVSRMALNSAEVDRSLRTLRDGRLGMDERVVRHHYAVLEKYGISQADFDGYVYLEKQAELREYNSLRNEVEWLQRLSLLHDKLYNFDDRGGVHVNLFDDRIFILSPQGELKELPVGATPVDFAYALGTDKGHRCHSARVNDKLVALDYPLHNGDVVEIISKQNPLPNRYWLSFVMSNLARKCIKDWFGDLDRHKTIEAGWELLNRHLVKLQRAALDVDLSILSRYAGNLLSIGEREHLLELIGNGLVSVESVIDKLVFDDLVKSERQQRKIKSVANLDLSKISVAGVSGLPLKLAACCVPGLADQIVGYVTRGSGITIHVFMCPVMRHNAADGRRLVPARWEGLQAEHVLYKLSVAARDRVGLLRDICGLIADFGINILDTYLSRHENNLMMRDFILEVQQIEKAGQLVSRLESLESVESVELKQSAARPEKP